MWRFPRTTTSNARLVAFATGHRSALLGAMVLNSFAVALWLVFGAGVWTRIQRNATGLFANCFGLGFAAFITLLIAGFVFFFVLVYRSPIVDEPRLLYDAAFGLLALSGLPTAVAL